MHQVYLGLGSNLGDCRKNLERAILLVSERVGTVTRQSSFVETEPWGFQSDNRFLNAVILCETDKTPREILRLTQQIERDMGRHKNVNRRLTNRNYTDRPIDVDEPDLKIPHPLMHERDFVMLPLREINNKL